RQQHGQQQQAFVAEHVEQFAEGQPVLGQVADDRRELFAQRGRIGTIARRWIPVAHGAQSTMPDSSGTNTTGPRSCWEILPSVSLVTRNNDCDEAAPTGATRLPPGASCAVSASTSAGPAAVTRIASNGPFSGQPMRP